MTVDEYSSQLPPRRRARLQALHRLFTDAVPAATVDMQYRMPNFHPGETAAALGNQMCAYFCERHLIDERSRRHPELKNGGGCVRIRDTQEPTDNLVTAFKRALAEDRHS